MDKKAILNLHKNDVNQLYIKEFLSFLKSDKGCRDNTITVYSQDLADFKKYFINKDLLQLKECDIRNYKYHLTNRNLAPRTINRKLSAIRSFYTYFVDSEEWSDIYKNPAKKVTHIKVHQDIPVILNESQADTLLDGILLTGTYAIRDYAIFSTFLFTGIRVSELIKLKIGDIDFDNHLLHVRDGKGGKNRSIPMIPRLETTLQIYLNNGIVHYTREIRLKTKIKKIDKVDLRKCGRELFILPYVDHDNVLFLTKEGRYFSDKGIDYLFKSYTKKLGIYREKLSLHALRRSCLTFLYKEGVDVFILKEISGHSRIQTLEHYLHIDKTRVLNAMQKHPLANQGLNMNLVDLVRK